MSKRVLVVDDTLFMRVKLKALLQNCGCQVVGEAGTGLEAIDQYKLLKPDITTMDITMPEMDGITALRQIKAIDPNAVVVMISALGQENNVIEAIKSGARHFIIKPFQDDKVKEVITKLYPA